MAKKLFSKSSIAGIAAVLLSASSFIAQFMLEGWKMNIEQWLSPLGITSALLFIGGVGLVVYNFFRRELTFDQKRKIVTEREEYLPILRDTVDKMLAIREELAIQAGRLPLEDYFDKYLNRNNAYNKAFKRLVNDDEGIRRKVAIIVALRNQKFHKYNPSLAELERSNDDLSKYQRLCESYLSRCMDNGLSGEYKELFKTANRYHLVLVLAEMGLSNDFKLKAAKYYKALYEKPKVLKPFIEFYRKRLNKVIERLLRGDDL